MCFCIKVCLAECVVNKMIIIRFVHLARDVHNTIIKIDSTFIRSLFCTHYNFMFIIY